MLDAFKLTAILISGILWGAWLVLVLRKKNVHPLRETLEGFSRLGWMKKVVVLFIVVQLTMFGGAKHGGTNDVDDVTNTNDVELVEGGTNSVDVVDGGETNGVDGTSGEAMSPSLLMVGARPFTSGETPLLHFVTPYRLESVSTNACYSYAMPAGGTIRGTWHLTGAYEDVQKVTLDGFVFPLGSDLCNTLWAYTWGKVRPQLKNASNEIAAVGAPMSAIPEVSRFWTAATSNDTYLLTWENFAAGRQSLTTNNQQLTTLSAQLELRRNGDFITRSNEVEAVWRRIDPDDWDGDGWRNDDDPDPCVWDEYWDSFGQELPADANESAYCWIEIRPRWNSYIEFYGDGPSDLDDPHLWAKAGETYRVQLLIGKTYAIESTQPLDVVGRSSSSIEIDGNGTSEIEVVWPVTFAALEGNGSGFVMRVVPSGLGGTFNWTQHCCTITGYGNQFWWAHERYCYCGGCYASGWYSYEGYERECTGGHCGCPYYDDDDPYESEEDDGPYAAGASVEFSESAVIFEGAYTNMPGEVVARQSTRTALTCIAHGGETGGTATFSIENGDKLVPCGGSLPVTRFVPPLQKIEFEIVYEGQLPSGSEEDIIAKADFTERGTGTRHSTVEDELTSVKVELEAVYEAPENHNPSRHIYGVGEKVRFKIFPQEQMAKFEVVKADSGDNVTAYDTFAGELNVENAQECVYTCPAAGTTPDITVSCLGVDYSPAMSVIEPQLVVTREATGSGTFWPGDVGMGILTTRNYIGPFTVSFHGVKVAEIPCTNAIPPIGYFATSNFTGQLTHVAGNAGWAHVIGGDNYWTLDEAGRTDVYENWSYGRLEWKIPIGWKRFLYEGDSGVVALEVDYASHGNSRSRPLLIGNSENAYKQVFSIESDGTSAVEKFGYKLERLRWSSHGNVINTDAR